MSAQYQYIRELGSGTFGCVVLAKDVTTGQNVAVKKIPRSQVQGYTLSELINHSMLRHPHIVKFHQVFLSPTNVNIVMEYVPDRSLLVHVQEVRVVPEHQARWLFQQLVFAIDYCHRKGVANRDIKLDNILLDKSERGKPDWPILKICDWGYAKNDVASLATSRVGTIAYMAPEVLHTTAGHYDGKKADIWSCGVVLYTMLVGGMPFKSTKIDNLGQMVVSLLADMRSQRFALPHTLSANAQDLLRRLLHPNPQQRITMADITTHPWFSVGLPSNALSMNDSYLRLPRSCVQSEEEICNIVAKASMSEQQLPKDQDREAAVPAGLVLQPQQHVQQVQQQFQQLPIQQQQPQQPSPPPQQHQVVQHHVQVTVPMQQEQQAEQQLQQQQLPYAVV